MNRVKSKPLLEAPASDANFRYETLGYVQAYDAVHNCDYAFVAYKEIDRTGKWRVRVNSSQGAGAVFEQSVIRSKARETSDQGKPWFQWGYCFNPVVRDPRNIQFRVHVNDGQPREVEMCLQLRKFDGSADQAQSVRFRWPDA